MTTRLQAGVMAILVILAAAPSPALAQEPAAAPASVELVKPNRADRARAVPMIILQDEMAQLQARLGRIETSSPDDAEGDDAEGDNDFEATEKLRVEALEFYFDRLVFDQRASLSICLQRFDRQLGFLLSQARARHNASPEEIVKLELAAKGDLKRLLDEIHLRRSEFVQRNGNVGPRLPLSESIKKLKQDIRKGPYSADSLFEKTLHKIRNQKETNGESRKGAGS